MSRAHDLSQTPQGRHEICRFSIGGVMEIIDLTSEHEGQYFTCLEPWSAEMAEAGDHKQRWYEQYKDLGLDVKLALADDGALVGMVQVLPVEETWVEGADLDLVLCIWVHGHDQGVGNRQGHGVGTALLEAAEAASRARGKKGMCAWGLALPVWMKASWYRKHGYKKVDRDGMAVLLLKDFTGDAKPPKWMRAQRTPESQDPGPVNVTAFVNGWCPVGSIACERAKCACAGFSPVDVQFTEIDTSDPAVMREWGRADALFVDDREIHIGPPPTEAAIHKQIDRAVRGPWWRRWIRS